jgi:hypothetical protein
MQDYMTAAVAARQAELRKVAGRRRVRRSRPVIDLDAGTTAETPVAQAAKELTLACTR